MAVYLGPVVAFAGDWHGTTDWACGRIMSLGTQGVDVILHVGDFGLWPGPFGKKYLNAVENACARYGVTLAVTPGNHEDWDRIDSRTPVDRGDGWGAVIWVTDHIAILPRGHRATLITPKGTERTMVSLGGAPSVDFDTRQPGKTWWPTEAITDADVDAAIAGGPADIMVAHDSPGIPYQLPAVYDICHNNPMGFSAAGLAYATEGRDRLTRAFEAITPRVFAHGHYHVSGQRDLRVGDREATIVGLDQQRTAGNIALLDLDTLAVVTTLR